LNYRHIFHAGNFADIFKHVLLARILVYLARKDASFRVIDTHAGAGFYNLSSREAIRGGEWSEGVRRLDGFEWSPEARTLLAPFLDVLAACNREASGRIYPGSPAIAQRLLRSQDRMIFCETHPEDVRALRNAIGRDKRAKVIAIDGYQAIRAYVPPIERRGLVLIDPPFEEGDERKRIAAGLSAAWDKWPTGVYVVWRPLKDAGAARALDTAVVTACATSVMRLDLSVDFMAAEGPLTSCGLLILNPPFILEEEARVLLPDLMRALARGPGASWRIERLA
jgi:23S rRNA (adenine2030-N6)-methyltransferase